jgi:hypothetical protein
MADSDRRWSSDGLDPATRRPVVDLEALPDVGHRIDGLSTGLALATSVGVAPPETIAAQRAATGPVLEGMGVMEFMVSSPGIVGVHRS